MTGKAAWDALSPEEKDKARKSSSALLCASLRAKRADHQREREWFRDTMKAREEEVK